MQRSTAVADRLHSGCRAIKSAVMLLFREAVKPSRNVKQGSNSLCDATLYRRSLDYFNALEAPAMFTSRSRTCLGGPISSSSWRGSAG